MWGLFHHTSKKNSGTEMGERVEAWGNCSFLLVVMWGNVSNAPLWDDGVGAAVKKTTSAKRYSAKKTTSVNINQQLLQTF